MHKYQYIVSMESGYPYQWQQVFSVRWDQVPENPMNGEIGVQNFKFLWEKWCYMNQSHLKRYNIQINE
jgi:hypothetical protein